MQMDDSLQHLKAQSKEKPLSRRDFVRVLTVASAAAPGVMTAALTGFSLTQSQRAEAAEMVVQGLGKLPKKAFGSRLGGMKVAPLCMSQDWNRDLLAPALELGVNFIHKAGYWNKLPDEIQKLPRESYYTDFTVDSTPNRPDDYDFAYNQITRSLESNGLKYYDIMRAHYGWRSIKDMKEKTGTYRAFEKLKKEGKVRYFGVSQHASPFDGSNYASYPEMIAAEIESGMVDAMQVWFAYKYPKEVEEVFAKASKAGIGMTAMKIFAQGNGRMRDDKARMDELKAGGKVGRACIREVMTTKRPDGKPIFHTCVSALGNLQVFEENIGGLSPKVAMRDGFEDHALLAL